MEKEKLPTIFRPERIPTKDYLKETFEEVKDEISSSEQRIFNSLVCGWRELAPKMEEFNYSDIEEDRKKLIERQKEAFGKMKTKEEKINYIRAKISEALLTNLIESEWMPEGLYFTETSEFDDWINRVDSVIEFEGKPEKAAVVDFTTSKNKEIVKEKIDKILEKIDSGTLSEVKYFKSQQDNKYYHLKMVPSLVIGVGSNTLKELSNLYLNKEREKLRNHLIKYALFHQIYSQINFLKEKVKDHRRKNYKYQSSELIELMWQKYDELEKIIRNLKENPLSELRERIEKQKVDPQKFIEAIATRMRKQDPVYKNIVDYTTKFPTQFLL